jgi:hypothetical protein
VSASFAVYRISDRDSFPPPPPVEDVAAFSAWELECDRLCLVEGPLASWDALYQYWTAPAQRLGLEVVPNFSHVFDSGLRVEGEDLGRLRSDIVALQRYWVNEIGDDEVLIDGIGKRQFSVPLVVDLYQRAEQLLLAVRVAERCSAYISFS